MMVVDNAYEIGDMVYLKTDPEQNARIVVSIKIYKDGELVYYLACGTGGSEHYEFEITKEKSYIKI